MKRSARIVGTLVFTGLAVAYLVWKIDLGTTVDVLADADYAWLALSIAIMIGSVPFMALRWKWLLRIKGIPERLAWLTRSYYVAYAAGQILPTSIGGDAVRVVETTRRHPGRMADITGVVLLERGLGGAATVLLGAIGFVLAIGHYDVGAYLWLEGLFVFGTIVLALLFFSRRARPLIARVRPLLRVLRVERPLRALYEAIHHYRDHPRMLVEVFLFTTAVQAVRVLAIWACARAVGIEEGPRLYFVMGPLFFLVLLVPFTLNGFAVREAFFVSFLGSAGVASDVAFAAGFLFFIVTVANAAPGGLILLWEGMRGSRAAKPTAELP
jgi:uncharacterized protein (TIRG00374 family)